jgi:dipeptidyl aminopeptidase/acylaminoacyl peptidase
MHTLSKCWHFKIAITIGLLFAAGCKAGLPTVANSHLTPIVESSSTPIVVTTSAFAAAGTNTPLVTPSASHSPVPSATRTPTQTPDPYEGLSIDSLMERAYGGGSISMEETLAVNSYFTRTLFSYPSDGLRIYGFMNVPNRGTPPYPVIIALHGYINPDLYDTLDYTTRYADALARAGYLVLHPNLRGYPPSEDGDNLFRVGMAIDVMNLIALIKDGVGDTGPLANAERDAIGVWGHSMGGGISTRVITISPDVRAAVLYGAMSDDEQKNFQRIFNYFSNGQRGLEELDYPPEAFERISPIDYLDRIQAAVSIHHGKNDPDVPLAWSMDLCQRLQDLGKSVECFTYEDQGHTFYDDGDTLFMGRMIEFFDRQLKLP